MTLLPKITRCDNCDHGALDLGFTVIDCTCQAGLIRKAAREALERPVRAPRARRHLRRAGAGR